MKIFIYLVLIAISSLTFAEGTESSVNNINAKYVEEGNFIQNPYGKLVSGGGTTNLNESQIESHNFAERLFYDGTWNVQAGASAQYTGVGNTGYPNYAYGLNLFGQTGQVGGFSVGGIFTAMNPFWAGQMNGVNTNSAPFLPANEQVTISEAYLEYQHSNILQLDVGYIGINNSPWLSNNYYPNVMSPGTTYQGILANLYLGSGWLLTALSFNGAQIVSETGFTPYTFYNKGYTYFGGTIPSNNPLVTSSGTAAVGANYAGWDNQYNLRIWGYEFNNYGTLLYADNSIKFQPSKALSFNLGAQVGTDNQLNNGSNALTNDNLGQISSNFVGLQGTFNYDWFGLSLGYNNVWGANSAYGNGAIVTPYTYGFATDPLYSTPYMAGLADFGTAGSALKLSPTFTFLDGGLAFSTAYTTFNTSVAQWNGTQEYDFTAMYHIEEIKGLSLFGVYAYQQVPTINLSGNSYITQIYISYVY